MKRFSWLLLLVMFSGGPGRCDELPEGLLCPVSGEDVDPEVSSVYRQAKVYFCCEKCQKAFAKDAAPFATKSNLQLVLTHQAVQKACPITGKAAKADVTTTVGGVEVQLCCGRCQKKVKEAGEGEQLELVFGDAPFEKGFEVSGADQ